MSNSFKGKTVAITGAAGGIGQWLCRYFGAEGATIAAFDKSEQVNNFAKSLGEEGITATPACFDIASSDAVKEVFELTHKGFLSGELNVLALIDANNIYFDAQARFLELKKAILIEAADLRLAAGLSVLVNDTGDRK